MFSSGGFTHPNNPFARSVNVGADFFGKHLFTVSVNAQISLAFKPVVRFNGFFFNARGQICGDFFNRFCGNGFGNARNKAVFIFVFKPVNNSRKLFAVGIASDKNVGARVVF